MPVLSLGETNVRGERRYEELRSTIEPAQNGRYISIEVESGKYFIGDTREDVVTQASAEFPGIITFSRKIGMVETVSRFSSKSENNHGGVLRFC